MKNLSFFSLSLLGIGLSCCFFFFLFDFLGFYTFAGIKEIYALLFLFSSFLLLFLILLAIKKKEKDYELKNKNIEQEIQLAQNLQKALIPAIHPPDFYASYQTMEKVGGDYYDYILFSDKNKIGIFLADVSGHGVAAALVTAMLKGLIIQISQMNSQKNNRFSLFFSFFEKQWKNFLPENKNYDFQNIIETPHLFLQYLNYFFKPYLSENEFFITAFYAIYDKKNKTLAYANAGHPNPFLISGQGITEIKPPQKFFPIGVFDKETFDNRQTTVSLSLSEKDKVLFYTDGLIETIRKENPKDFFYSHIPKILLEISDKPKEELVQTLLKQLEEFRGDTLLQDDLTLICLEVQ